MPTPAPPTRLTKLKITEISDVDAGANQHAYTAIVKSNANNGGPVADTNTNGTEELQKRLDAQAAELAKAKADADILAKRLADIEEADALRKCAELTGSLATIAKGAEAATATTLRRLQKAAAKADDAALVTDVLALLTKAETVHKAASDSLGKAIGSNEDAAPNPATALNKAAEAIAKRDGINFSAAYQKACREHEDLYLAARAPKGV